MAQFELVDFEKTSSFRCMKRRATDFREDHPLHFHPQFELTWIIHSTGLQFVGDSVEYYDENYLVLCGPDLPHCWQNNLINAEDAAEWFTIQFDRELLPVNMETMIELQAVSQMLKRASGGLKFQSVPDSVYLNNDCTATIREEIRF